MTRCPAWSTVSIAIGAGDSLLIWSRRPTPAARSSASLGQALSHSARRPAMTASIPTPSLKGSRRWLVRSAGSRRNRCGRARRCSFHCANVWGSRSRPLDAGLFRRAICRLHNGNDANDGLSRRRQCCQDDSGGVNRISSIRWLFEFSWPQVLRCRRRILHCPILGADLISIIATTGTIRPPISSMQWRRPAFRCKIIRS